MQQAPNDRLHSVIRSGTGVPRFSPAVDDVTLFANNTARLESGLVAKVVGDELRSHDDLPLDCVFES
jgi:hypothetical protein